MELGQWHGGPARKFEAEANAPFDTPGTSIEKIYGDIKATLRVSVISLPFSLWSTHPRLLEFLWNQLKPNLATRYVESAADRIRERAVRTVEARLRLRELQTVAGSQLTAVTIQLSRSLVDIHHYVNPKLLIATAGLLEALQGHSFEPVKDRELRMTVPQGIPAAMPRLAVREEPSSEQGNTALLKEIQEMLSLPAVSSEYLCLSSLCGYLERVWAELKLIIKTETYWQLAEDLESLAALLARGLPYPIAFGREDLERIGLTVLEARNWIIPSHMAIARLILNMAALKVALDGKQEALHSPFPISTGAEM
jgi:Halocarboxylic acid dehydrogenase DehI